MRNVIDRKEYDHIVMLYQEGKSQDYIAKQYGVSRHAISYVLKQCCVVSRDDSHKYRKYTLDENYFDQIDCADKAYILGLLYSDGCNSEQTRHVKIALQERDADVLVKINELLGSNRPLMTCRLHDKNDAHQNSVVLSIVNQHMSKKLSELGVISNKSLRLTFPTYISQELLPHFLRGYVDGDGHISKRGYVYIACTEQFCSSLLDICRSMNIKAGMTYTQDHNSRTKIFYICNKCGSKKFLDYLYNDAKIYIQRKHDIYINLYNKSACAA